MKWLAAAILVVTFAVGGYAFAAAGDQTVVACAHAQVDAQTIAVNGNSVYTVPGQIDDECVTTTVAAPQPTTPTNTAPQPEMANLWVNTTAGGTPTRCPDAGGCVYNPTTAFGSIVTACNAAQSGDLVLVKGGDYPGDPTNNRIELGNCVGKTSDVVFRSATGEQVNLTGELSARATQARKVSHLEFANMTLSDFYFLNTDSITFLNDSMKFFFVRASSNIKLLDSDIGGINTGVSPTIGTTGAGGIPSSNVLVEHNNFHDNTRTATGTHLECLFVQESDGVTVSRNSFSNCDTITLYVNPIFNGVVSNATIINNDIHPPTDHAAGADPTCPGCVALNIGTGGTHTNVHVLFNSLGGSLGWQMGAGSGGLVEGNVGHLTGGTNGSCQAGITYKYNIWDNAACDPTDARAPNGFVSDTDYNLQPGAKGMAFVPAAGCDVCPTVDKDNNPRSTTMMNAGAHENH